MGKWVRGTAVPLEVTIENKVTLARVDVSNISLYVLKDDVKVASLAVSHITTGYYRGYWQTTSNTELGKHKYQFVYKYQDYIFKKNGIVEVVS